MQLSRDTVEQIKELTVLASKPGVRYRNYALVTPNQRVMYDVSAYVGDVLGGEVLDILDDSLAHGDLLAVSPMDLISWIGARIRDRAPRCLLHVDAVLSTWRNAGDHRVWWEQLSMVEAPCPLFVPTARVEIAEVTARWLKVGTFYEDTSRVDVYAPRASSHLDHLLQPQEVYP